MSNIYAISDLHFGHKNICNFRPFETRVEHEDVIMENYKRIIRKRDTVLFLGDIAFTDEGLEKIATLPGRKILIQGNHCFQFYTGDIRKIYDVFDKVLGSYKRWGVWFTHIPIHPSELRGNYNFHGHTHNSSIEDTRYLNLCLEKTDYKPVAVKPLIEKIKLDNPDYEEKRRNYKRPPQDT